MTLLETGKIVTTHGVRGEVRAEYWCDSPEQLAHAEQLYLADGTPLAVEYGRVHRGAVNLKLKGYDDIDASLALIGVVLYVDKDAIALPEGTYFIGDLMGLAVVDDNTGLRYGTIVQVQSTGANDVYHVQDPGGRLLLVPAIRDVVRRVDLQAGTMAITPLEGLFDL